MNSGTVFTGLVGLWAGVALPVCGWAGWHALRTKQAPWAAGCFVAILVSIGSAATMSPPLFAVGLLFATACAIAYPVMHHRRVPFQLWVATVWLCIFVVVATLFALSGFDTAWMQENGAFIAAGIWVTIVIAISAIALATVLALLGSLGRLSKNPIAYGLSGFYTSFFRGTPLIVQMFLIYLALPQMAQGLGLPREIEKLFLLDAIVAGILALGLNYGAYMTEIFRAGIQSVSHGQREAAEALGMTYRQVMRRVVLPQAFRVIIPPTGNEFIAMIKDTALVSFLGTSVAMMEIFRRSQLVGKADFRNLEAYLVVAAMYWILTIIFTFFQAKLEKRNSRGYVRATQEFLDESAAVIAQQGPLGGTG